MLTIERPGITFVGDHARDLARTHDWDSYFLRMAQFVSSKSKDRSTQVGAVIVSTEGQAVLSTGWNGFPRGVDDDPPERHERPAKYDWTEHAERNAVYNAVREGVRLLGATLYTTLYPCCDCARAIVQSGIKCLVTVEPEWDDPHRTATSRHFVSKAILAEGGVEVRFLPPETLQLS